MPKLKGIMQWTGEILRVPVDGAQHVLPVDEELLIKSIMLFPPRNMTNWQHEPLGEFQFLYNDKTQPLYRAPVESMINRWMMFTKVDEHFETRALWFLAEDLMGQIREQTKSGLVPLTEEFNEKLKAARQFTTGVQFEFMQFHSMVAFFPFEMHLKSGFTWRLLLRNAPQELALDAELCVLHRTPVAT